jgi:hypothetical protein
MYYLEFNKQDETFYIYSEDTYLTLKEQPSNVITFEEEYLHMIKEILGMNI